MYFTGLWYVSIMQVTKDSFVGTIPFADDPSRLMPDAEEYNKIVHGNKESTYKFVLPILGAVSI